MGAERETLPPSDLYLPHPHRSCNLRIFQPMEDAYSYGSYVVHEKRRGSHVPQTLEFSGTFFQDLPLPHLLSFLLLFWGVYVCACVCAGMHAHWRKCGGQRLVNQVNSLLLPSETGSLTEPEAHWMANQEAPGSSCSGSQPWSCRCSS